MKTQEAVALCPAASWTAVAEHSDDTALTSMCAAAALIAEGESGVAALQDAKKAPWWIAKWGMAWRQSGRAASRLKMTGASRQKKEW
jgi:hypothetical protein